MTQVLRGNIIHTPKMGELSILEHGYMVLEDGVIRGVYPTRATAQSAAVDKLLPLLDEDEEYEIGETPEEE